MRPPLSPRHAFPCSRPASAASSAPDVRNQREEHHVTSRPTKAVIPAAGLGTRFLPATKATPKEMLPVVDK
ncbi:hypothetical protein ACFWI4_17545, partial [Streptomyces sp. NPDC127038]